MQQRMGTTVRDYAGKETVRQTQFLAVLAAVTEVDRVLQVGLFTGFATQFLAERISDRGQVVAIEDDAFMLDFATRHLEKSPETFRKVKIMKGRPGANLDAVAAEGRPYRLVYVDHADGWTYAEQILRDRRILEVGGLRPGYLVIELGSERREAKSRLRALQMASRSFRWHLWESLAVMWYERADTVNGEPMGAKDSPRTPGPYLGLADPPPLLGVNTEPSLQFGPSGRAAGVVIPSGPMSPKIGDIPDTPSPSWPLFSPWDQPSRPVMNGGLIAIPEGDGNAPDGVDVETGAPERTSPNAARDDGHVLRLQDHLALPQPAPQPQQGPNVVLRLDSLLPKGYWQN
jgi:predicted O-methyltransferase YrrM